MFREGCQVLESTQLNEYNQIQMAIVAFRAGGWAIQPFSLFKAAFEAANIE